MSEIRVPIMSQEVFIEKVKKIKPNIEILSEYKGRKEKVKLRCKKTEEEVLEDYKIENIELVEGSYEDSVEDSDIKLEVTSEEDRKLIKDLMKDR